MQRLKSKVAQVPAKLNAPDDKLTDSQMLLAAITSLTKAVQGMNLQSVENTAAPATAPKTQQVTLQYRSRTIKAGANFTEYVVGNFFFMFSNGNANQTTNFYASFNNEAFMNCPAKFKFKTNYTRINFFNNDAADAAIVYFVGSGDIDYES